MITPNKFISLDRSVLSRLPIILSALDDAADLPALYQKTETHFDSIVDFLLAVDVLHLLNRLNVNPKTGDVSRAI